MDDSISEVIEYMEDLTNDDGVSKNVRAKISKIISELKTASEENINLKVNKILSELDEIASDANLDQFTRQQIWSISGMLEGI
ncbi:MAG: UPF0147 family protein [Patescibacteria group bacterium]|nr:UPF0147 family protein [Patescibacteria group bacterium]